MSANDFGERLAKGWLVSRNIFLVLSLWKEVLLIGLAGLVSGSGGTADSVQEAFEA